MSQEKSEYAKYLERKGVVILAAEIPNALGEIVESAIKASGLKKIAWVNAAVIAAVRAQGFEYTPVTPQTELQKAQTELEALRAELEALKAQTPPTPPEVEADPATGKLKAKA